MHLVPSPGSNDLVDVCAVYDGTPLDAHSDIRLPAIRSRVGGGADAAVDPVVLQLMTWPVTGDAGQVVPASSEYEIVAVVAPNPGPPL